MFFDWQLFLIGVNSRCGQDFALDEYVFGVVGLLMWIETFLDLTLFSVCFRFDFGEVAFWPAASTLTKLVLLILSTATSSSLCLNFCWIYSTRYVLTLGKVLVEEDLFLLNFDSLIEVVKSHDSWKIKLFSSSSLKCSNRTF